MKREEAIISPSWAMVGENQEFTDLDYVAVADLRARWISSRARGGRSTGWYVAETGSDSAADIFGCATDLSGVTFGKQVA